MSSIVDIFNNNKFQIIASAIRKRALSSKYPYPQNPYNLALSFGMKRVFLELNSRGCGKGKTFFVFESRGRKEDENLELEFRRCLSASYNATGKDLPFNITFSKKASNSAGLQLADLTARPIGRHVIDPSQSNRAYEVVKGKLRTNSKGEIANWGLKIFP